MKRARPVASDERRSRFHLTFGAATDSCDDLTHSTDFHCLEPSLGLFAVADGVDSESGWLTSRTLVRALRQYVAEAVPDPLVRVDANSTTAGRLRAGLVLARQSVGDYVPDKSSEASVCAVLVAQASVAVASDRVCRVYLGRAGRLRRVPEAVAHRSPLEIFGGHLAARHPTASGMTGGVDRHLDIVEVAAQPGDRWLLCSDGLHGALSDQQIAKILFDTENSLTALSKRLVGMSVERGRCGDSTAIALDLGAFRSVAKRV